MREGAAACEDATLGIEGLCRVEVLSPSRHSARLSLARRALLPPPDAESPFADCPFNRLVRDPLSAGPPYPTWAPQVAVSAWEAASRVERLGPSTPSGRSAAHSPVTWVRKWVHFRAAGSAHRATRALVAAGSRGSPGASPPQDE